MTLLDWLRELDSREGSDLYLSTGARPMVRVNGVMTPLDEPLPNGAVAGLLDGAISDAQRAEFGAKPELNFAVSEPGLGRFRVNAFRQRGEVSIVARSIKTDIPSIASLGLPPLLKKLSMAPRGLILFVGATGSGKSTSLASMVDYRNANAAGHIITIEDPIEFVHRHKQSIVNQREVGMDTDNYQDALENTLRQAPDVILIGEIRSRETMEHAIAFAETGHLCLSTLHANNANQALDRIINFFPEERRDQLLMDLSLNLRAIVSQRLVKTPDAKRTAAVEVLLGSPRVSDLIRQGEVGLLKEAMEQAATEGMVTFDSALLELWKAGTITVEEALRNADSENNLRLAINLA
ncbi:MAG: PilT/PilU family type 4a pilus ATPase, partial [Litorivicinus sp.]